MGILDELEETTQREQQINQSQPLADDIAAKCEKIKQSVLKKYVPAAALGMFIPVVGAALSAAVLGYTWFQVSQPIQKDNSMALKSGFALAGVIYSILFFMFIAATNERWAALATLNFWTALVCTALVGLMYNRARKRAAATKEAANFISSTR